VSVPSAGDLSQVAVGHLIEVDAEPGGRVGHVPQDVPEVLDGAGAAVEVQSLSRATFFCVICRGADFAARV
jgi:hypothetical protein